MLVADAAVRGAVQREHVAVDADRAQLLLDDLRHQDELGVVAAHEDAEGIVIGPAGLVKEGLGGLSVALVVGLAARLGVPQRGVLEHVGRVEVVVVLVAGGGEHDVVTVDHGLHRAADGRVGGNALALVEHEHRHLILAAEDRVVGIALELGVVIDGQTARDIILARLDAGVDRLRIAREIEVDFVVVGVLVAAPAGVVAVLAVGLVVGVLLELDVLVSRPLGELVGAGADVAVLIDELALGDIVQNGGRHDDGLLAETADHLVEIRRAVVHLDLHGIVIDLLEARIAHERLDVVGRADPAVHAGDDVVRLHLFAVVELHALAQRVGVNAVVLTDLAVLSQLIDDLVLAVERDELFQNGAVDDFACDILAAHGNVEVVRRAVERDVQHLGVRRRLAAVLARAAGEQRDAQHACQNERDGLLHNDSS